MSHPSVSEIIVERLETYTPEDVVQLGLLRNALSSQRSPQPLLPERVDFFTQHEEHALIVARQADSGQIVAAETIAGTPMLEAEDDEPFMFGTLGFVSTLPDKRNQGIGKQVAIGGMERCRDFGIEELRFTSNSNNPERRIAREVYLKYGAKIVSEGVKPKAGDPDPKNTDYFRWSVAVGLNALTSPD